MSRSRRACPGGVPPVRTACVMSDVVLLFSGQGAQKVGMGKDFHEASATAREIFRQADEALQAREQDAAGARQGEARGPLRSAEGQPHQAARVRLVQRLHQDHGAMEQAWRLVRADLQAVPAFKGKTGSAKGMVLVGAIAGAFGVKGEVRLRAALRYVAHWVTPVGETRRRFDTRFFVAKAPDSTISHISCPISSGGGRMNSPKTNLDRIVQSSRKPPATAPA